MRGKKFHACGRQKDEGHLAVKSEQQYRRYENYYAGTTRNTMEHILAYFMTAGHQDKFSLLVSIISTKGVPNTKRSFWGTASEPSPSCRPLFLLVFTMILIAMPSIS